MNLSEVKKHVIFQLVIYILVGICFALSIFIILITPAKAQEQTTDITSSIRTNFDCPWGYNSYGYCAIQTDNGGGVRSFNTRYNGVLNTIAFGFPYYFNQYSNNEIIDIYSTSNDFRNNNINVFCYSYESSPSQSNVRSCSLRFISQKHIQVIFPYDSLQWHEIILTSYNAITGVSNYLIQKVTLTYDDGQQDLTGIIDNATSNTTDIINNNNANSEATQNAIFESASSIITELINACKNLFSPNFDIFAINGVTINSRDNNQINFTTNWNGFGNVVYALDVTPNTAYYLDLNIINSNENGQVIVSVEDMTDSIINQRYFSGNGNLYFSFNSGNNERIKLKFFGSTSGNGNTVIFKDIMLSHEALYYCPFGSHENKIDWINSGLSALGYTEEQIKEIQEDIKDTQQQQYDYLTDDSDPTFDSSEFSDVMESTQIVNPLGYLATLPVTLLAKINTALNASCQDFEIGHFGFQGTGWGETLKFPCMHPERQLGSNLWNLIDVIMGIGLLALTIYKIYHAVANILSMGAENEVEHMFHYLTPMEFLSAIIGVGGIGGVTK